MKTYSEKLKDPRWQRRRLEIMQRDDFKCRQCGDSTATLHIHHLRYRSGIEPWEYGDMELLTLCEKCHTEEHAIDEKIESENVVNNWLRSIDRILWNGASLKTYRECVAVAVHAYRLNPACRGTIISMLIKKVSAEFGVELGDVTKEFTDQVMDHINAEQSKPRFIR